MPRFELLTDMHHSTTAGIEYLVSAAQHTAESSLHAPSPWAKKGCWVW